MAKKRIVTEKERSRIKRGGSEEGECGVLDGSMGFLYLGLLRRGTLNAIEVFFSTTLFLSEHETWLVCQKRACFWLVWVFLIPVYSPGDKRGRSVSRNRGLGIGIRAGYGRFRAVLVNQIKVSGFVGGQGVGGRLSSSSVFRCRLVARGYTGVLMASPSLAVGRYLEPAV